MPNTFRVRKTRKNEHTKWLYSSNYERQRRECHVSIDKRKCVPKKYTTKLIQFILTSVSTFTSSSSIIYCLTTTIFYTWVFNIITHTSIHTPSMVEIYQTRVSVSFCVRDRMELWQTFSHLFQNLFHKNQCTRSLSYTRELFLSWRKLNAILILSFIFK